MDLFPLLYFPPISYFLDWKKSLDIYIEVYDNYQRRSFRNSMEILTSSGRLQLSVPILHVKSKLLRDLKINFNSRWREIHWKTLYTAYRNSCYFEYYEEDIYKLIYYDTKYLFEFNHNILDWVIKIFQLPKYNLTTEFKDIIIGKDYRDCYSRKTINLNRITISYHQVFSDRYIFENNLSILDFLFNVGPNIDLLK